MITKLEQQLIDLIAVRSHAGNTAGFEDLKRWVEQGLIGLPYHVVHKTSGGHDSWLVTTGDTLQPKVLFCIHLDVVTGPDKVFSAKITDKKIIGRGAIDMKFSGAILMNILQTLKEPLNYDFGVLFTTDEELGGFHGPPVWIEAGLKPEVVVVPDGGANWQFERSAKGVIHIQVECSGNGVHASRIVQGDSAIDKMIDFLSEIRETYPPQHNGADLTQVPTCNVGIIQGGEVVNQVAHKACAELDIRVPYTISTSAVWHHFNIVAEKFAGMKITKTADSEAFLSNTDNEYVQSFLQIARTTTGKDIPFTDSLGSSDARFFALESVPTIIMLPEGGNPHENNEWVSRKALAQYHDILMQYIGTVADKTHQQNT